MIMNPTLATLTDHGDDPPMSNGGDDLVPAFQVLQDSVPVDGFDPDGEEVKT
jgi:hypothetical protein